MGQIRRKSRNTQNAKHEEWKRLRKSTPSIITSEGSQGPNSRNKYTARRKHDTINKGSQTTALITYQGDPHKHHNNP